MPESVRFLPRADLLSFEEIERVVRIGAGLGIRKLRLTGGEPLVRRDLPTLIRQLANVPGIEDIGLTTNGLLLAPLADSLRQAGLRRINISLDTLDPSRFEALTRRAGLDQVIEGIFAAKAAGFDPIKLNAIALKGETEQDIVPLAQFAREHQLELRFIEYMPLDVADHWERSKVLTADEILARLSREIGPLRPAQARDQRAPATDFDFEDGRGRIGIIASVSHSFCARCNRIRLTADGKLRNCLFSLEESDLRALIRGGGSDADLAKAIRQSVLDKWEGHTINSIQFIKPDRLMHSIGG